MAAILYSIFSTPVFQLDENYYFTGNSRSGEIRVTGGDTVIPRGDLRLWGKYPWIYGTLDDGGFVIDLKEKRVTVWDAEALARKENPFQSLIEQEKLDLSLCRTWSELFEKENSKELRYQLKRAVSRPVPQKKSVFF